MFISNKAKALAIRARNAERKFAHTPPILCYISCILYQTQCLNCSNKISIGTYTNCVFTENFIIFFWKQIHCGGNSLHCTSHKELKKQTQGKSHGFLWKKLRCQFVEREIESEAASPFFVKFFSFLCMFTGLHNPGSI